MQTDSASKAEPVFLLLRWAAGGLPAKNSCLTLPFILPYNAFGIVTMLPVPNFCLS
jgi:hypothetical protein